MATAPVVQSLILKRFRSVPTACATFDNPTFLVGRNGSGKSNVVDAFAFLAEAMASPLQAVFDRRAGISVVRNRSSAQSRPPNLGFAVTLGPVNSNVVAARYAFEVRALLNYGFAVDREQCLVRTAQAERYWFDRAKNRYRSNVGLGPALDPAALVLPLVGGDARFAPVLRALAGMKVYSIQPAELREMQDPDSGASLRPDGSNAASVLKELERHESDDIRRVCEILATIVPNTRRVRTVKHGNKLSLEFTQEWGAQKRLKFESFNMSDGTLRALGLLMAVYQRPRPSLIAIEEPEATIHPGALGAILDLLRHAAQSMQVVITTHSPEVLDADWIESRHLRIVSWEQGATFVTPVADAARKALQQHLMGAGELLRSNALHAPPLFHDVAQPSLFEELE